MKPVITTFSSMKRNGSQLSSSLYNLSMCTNLCENHVPLRMVLYRALERSDLGKEVGSINYVNNSRFFFIKTKALQPYSFLPILNSESTESIMPDSFLNYNLKSGDILLSKDGNIGEIIILDRDYPNYMLSGALYKLPLNEDEKYYVLACIKHRYFREQLDRIVPKGATLRHAGTRFLECNIPYPVNHRESILRYVSLVTRRIINIEVEIKNRNNKINGIIEKELVENQKRRTDYKFSHVTYKNLSKEKRLDTGVYSESFQQITHLLNNYNGGAFTINPNKLKSGSTPKIRSISQYQSGQNRWITPTNCSDWGYIQTHEGISTPAKINLEQDASLLINRTSRGGKGEYVGVATFYDYNSYGKGHHNQGIYRITGYDRKILVFITTFMNTHIMRKYCSALSVGSKMKEIKSEQFLRVPIPSFPDNCLNRIYELFYTESFDTSIDNILSQPLESIGLFHLSISKDILTQHLNSVLDMITECVEFEVVDNKIKF